jgi:UDP-N-acetylglucosamine transferase subunit ALG13
MIFVTTGTAPFPRLVKKMDEIARKKKEEVIIQIGNTEYKPKNARYFDFIESYRDIQDLNREARVVVCPASAGAIITALEEKKPVIAVPRLKRYNEHSFDDDELARALIKEGLIAAVVYNIDELENAIRSVKGMTINIKKDERKKLINFLKTYLDDLKVKSKKDKK